MISPLLTYSMGRAVRYANPRDQTKLYRAIEKDYIQEVKDLLSMTPFSRHQTGILDES